MCHVHCFLVGYLERVVQKSPREVTRDVVVADTLRDRVVPSAEQGYKKRQED